VKPFDEQLKHSLHNLAADVRPDPNDLPVVRRRAVVVRRRAQRMTMVGVVASVALVAAAIFALNYAGRQRAVLPVGPPPSSTSTSSGGLREVTNPFTVLRTIQPASLGMSHPLKAAVAPDGHVYITDRDQHVTELTASGAVVRSWGGKGTAPGQFRLYSGALAVGPDGRVYVADTGNFRIQVFTPTGRFLAAYGGYGQGPGKFVWPSDVVVGPNGDMYVADDRAATVTALSPDGRQLWRRGAPGETDPNLIGHEHLGGVDAAGQLVTANDDVGEVLYLGSGGRVEDSFSTDQAGADVDASGISGGHFPNGACGATLDPQGNVYVSSCEESYGPKHDTAVYDPEHRLVAGWKRGVLVDSPVFGSDGHAWAVTSGNQTVVELKVQLPGSRQQP